MEPFEIITGIAAPLPMINVDTDMIIPKQFLKTIKRTGLGKNLFHELRTHENGKENKNFVLNKPQWKNAKILITGDNFGCGSSREHAPWAILDFGIKAIIAPGFADIFYNNCFKNGILPIILPNDIVDDLSNLAERGQNASFTINLETQTITDPDGRDINFNIDLAKKKILLEGLDDIAMTLKSEALIEQYEQNNSHKWL